MNNIFFKKIILFNELLLILKDNTIYIIVNDVNNINGC